MNAFFVRVYDPDLNDRHEAPRPHTSTLQLDVLVLVVYINHHITSPVRLRPAWPLPRRAGTPPMNTSAYAYASRTWLS